VDKGEVSFVVELGAEDGELQGGGFAVGAGEMV
jgi:hypothetical protein